VYPIQYNVQRPQAESVFEYSRSDSDTLRLLAQPTIYVINK
jgi:hypothetical protein